MKKQHVVLVGLTYDPKKLSHKKSIDDFFKKKNWGKLTYELQFKTLPSRGGPGGRNDVVFVWSGTHDQLGRFSVQRLVMGSNAPRWLEDYIDNNREIIPASVLSRLEKLRAW